MPESFTDFDSFSPSFEIAMHTMSRSPSFQLASVGNIVVISKSESS